MQHREKCPGFWGLQQWLLEEYGLVTDDYHRTQWVWFAVTFTAIWRNFSSAKWRIAGEISKKSRTDVRA